MVSTWIRADICICNITTYIWNYVGPYFYPNKWPYSNGNWFYLSTRTFNRSWKAETSGDLLLYCGGFGHIAINCSHWPRRQVYQVSASWRPLCWWNNYHKNLKQWPMVADYFAEYFWQCNPCQRTDQLIEWDRMSHQPVLPLEPFDKWGLNFVRPFKPRRQEHAIGIS